MVKRADYTRLGNGASRDEYDDVDRFLQEADEYSIPKPLPVPSVSSAFSDAKRTKIIRIAAVSLVVSVLLALVWSTTGGVVSDFSAYDSEQVGGAEESMINADIKGGEKGLAVNVRDAAGNEIEEEEGEVEEPMDVRESMTLPSADQYEGEEEENTSPVGEEGADEEDGEDGEEEEAPSAQPVVGGEEEEDDNGPPRGNEPDEEEEEDEEETVPSPNRVLTHKTKLLPSDDDEEEEVDGEDEQNEDGSPTSIHVTGSGLDEEVEGEANEAHTGEFEVEKQGGKALPTDEEDEEDGQGEEEEGGAQLRPEEEEEDDEAEAGEVVGQPQAGGAGSQEVVEGEEGEEEQQPGVNVHVEDVASGL